MLKLRRSVFSFCFVLLLPAFALCVEPSRETSAQFQEQLQSIASSFGGKVTLAGVNLKTGERFGLASDRPVATASTIKLPIMVEVFYQVKEGKLSWSQPVAVTDFDRVDGSGILQFLSPEARLTLADAVTLMIDLSDNTATNVVIHQVGVEAVNTRMTQLGLKHTKLFRYVYHDVPVETDEMKQFGLGVTTADDMVLLLTLIQQRKILSPADCDRMMQILGQQEDNDAFPRYTGSMAGVSWAHKTGALDAVRNDVGIAQTPAGPIVLAGFAYDSPDHQWSADNAAVLVLGRLAKAVLEHFVPPAAKANL